MQALRCAETTQVIERSAEDVAQSYEILEEIDAGANATVYLAIYRRGRVCNRHVALKKVRLAS